MGRAIFTLALTIAIILVSFQVYSAQVRVSKGAPAIFRTQYLSVSASPLPPSSRRDWKKIYQDEILGLDFCMPA
jgi:hypothetical protein